MVPVFSNRQPYRAVRVYEIQEKQIALSAEAKNAAKEYPVPDNPISLHFVSNIFFMASKTSFCEVRGSRRIRAKMFNADSLSGWMFFLPKLQAEQRTRKFSLLFEPPWLKGIIWSMLSRIFRFGLKGSVSPGPEPHNWQVNPLRSRISFHSWGLRLNGYLLLDENIAKMPQKEFGAWEKTTW